MYHVLYFTRTGNSKRIAQKIGTQLQVMPVEIEDSIDWSGPSAYLRCISMMLFKKEVAIKLQREIVAEEGDEYVVVSPLWAGRPAPTVQAFLKTVPGNRTHLVVSAAKGSLKDRSGYKSVTDIHSSAGDEDDAIGGLMEKLHPRT